MIKKFPACAQIRKICDCRKNFTALVIITVLIAY